MATIDKISVDGTVYDVAPAAGTVTASMLPKATTSTVGAVSVSTGLSVTTAGALSVKAATTSAIGGVKPSTGLSVTSAGALSVKAATTTTLGGVSVGSGLSVTTSGAISVNVTTVLKAVYPVGSIYANYSNSANPATLLGFGTWVAIGGTFLLGADSTYAAGSTGGEAEHTLTVDEIPSHRHDYTAPSRNSGSEWIGEYGTGASQTLHSDYTGGGAAHNNMPPYTAVYMWRRTA